MSNIARFGKSVFICSKPLQVFNALSIVDYYAIKDTKIYLVKIKIHECEKFVDYLKATYFSDNINALVVVEDYKEAQALILSIMDHETLFVEDDRVSLYFVFKKIKTNSLIVYEEGFGTYSSHYKHYLTGIKYIKWLLLSWLFGCGMGRGYGRRTDQVVVQDVELYRMLHPSVRTKAIYFPGCYPIINSKIKSWEQLIVDELPLGALKNKDIAFILGSWGAENLVYEIDLSHYEFVIYKPHPHDGSKIDGSDCLYIKNSWIPAEAFILVLSKLAKSLSVLHFSSTSVFFEHYLPPNVRTIDLLKRKRYVDIKGLAYNENQRCDSTL